MSKDEKVVNLALPSDIHKKLKLRAAREETTVKEIVIRAITEYCKNDPD